MTKEKIKNQKKIIQVVKNLKKKGKKIVTFSGSFDILHSGHIKALEEAKKQGDILIILLNSDKSIRGYKGPLHPVNSQKDRAQLLSALEMVDYILQFDELTPNKILSEIRPDIHCNGSDWGKDCIEKEIVEKEGGKIYVLKWNKGFSTTKLVKKILASYSKPEIKAVFLDRDGTINLNQPEYLHKIEDFKFAPFVISALQKLSKSNYKIIVLTNQSGIGRGYFKKVDLKKLHQWMIKESKKKKIRIDKIYYCPHHPRDNCSCRKPKLGLLMKAVQDFGLNLSKSWVVGDEKKDIIMGRMVNSKTIMVGGELLPKSKIKPNYYTKNLLEAVKIILSS